MIDRWIEWPVLGSPTPTGDSVTVADHFEFDPWQSFDSRRGRWYTSVELLGVGGNAATFLAYCTSSPIKGTLYAVKVFRKLSKPERRDSFLDEIRFLENCDHPAILRTHDDGVFQDNPFIVMEYLPATLANVMRRGCSFVEKVSYAIQLVSALEYLDSLNTPVVHRDIKPANIFIKGGSCVLGDFGLMKRVSDDPTMLKESHGPGMAFFYRTPDLISYLKGESGITTKSDVFQLGLVLAHLFTGWNPLRVTNDFYAPLELDPLKHIPSQLGGTVASLIKRMLTVDHNLRPRAADIIDGWQGAFRTAVDAAHVLEDRAFHH